MKILLFFSVQSSLSHVFKNIFSLKCEEVEIVDYLDFLPSYYHKLLDKSGRLPGTIEKNIRKLYLKKIQLKYIERVKEKNPDIILVYNDQMLCAETLNHLNKKIRIGVYLADSPLFLNKREHIIELIRRVDVVFAPDTYWLEQCKMLGAKKTEYLIPGFNTQNHFKLTPSGKHLREYSSDIFFMGSPYNDNWGYKRALFLSKFCKFNFRFLGPENWKYWFSYFPELGDKFVLKKDYLAAEELNLQMNCSKIIPVDANPGIINGFHIRVFDSIASGVLPLIEHRKDLDEIFKETGLPFITNYNDIPEITWYYVNHNIERNTLLEKLQNTVIQKFSNESAANNIFSAFIPSVA